MDAKREWSHVLSRAPFLRNEPQGQNFWQWAKILDAGEDRLSGDEQACLAYSHDRIAVSYSKGVKIWVWSKGMTLGWCTSIEKIFLTIC